MLSWPGRAAQLLARLALALFSCVFLDLWTEMPRKRGRVIARGSLQEQLGVSERSPLQFPELEHELAEASEEAAEALKALLAGLHSREARGRQTEELQKLHEESVECQERRRRLERELFERRLKELKAGKEQGMLQASLQMLESMSRWAERFRD